MYRIFMAEKRFEYRHATEEELEALKMREFAGWMRTYVSAENKFLYYLPNFYTNICFINRCLMVWPEVKQLMIGYAR